MANFLVAFLSSLGKLCTDITGKLPQSTSIGNERGTKNIVQPTMILFASFYHIVVIFFCETHHLQQTTVQPTSEARLLLLVLVSTPEHYG